MKKSYLATVFFLAAMLLCGCLSSQTDAQEEMIDLHSDIDWKAPDPAVSQRPKILFVGNSHTFTTTFPAYLSISLMPWDAKAMYMSFPKGTIR